MKARWIIAASFCGLLFGGITQAASRCDEPVQSCEPELSLAPASPTLIDEIVFRGLRRIASAAVQAQISSRKGETLNPKKIENDVRALARLGWFDEISVEALPALAAASSSSEIQPRVRLLFVLEELPYLTGVEYVGSRLLSHAQIEKLLEESHLTARLGEPADPAALGRIAQAIRVALAELGHPQSKVQIRLENYPNETVHVVFRITEGSCLPVGQISFEGNPELPETLLRRQMRHVVPQALFASLRGKDAYTRGAFEEDRQRILAYYQNHGYPEARIGDATLDSYERHSRRWLPLPHRTANIQLAVSIPIQAGPYYRFGALNVSHPLFEMGGHRADKLQTLANSETGRPYSEQVVETLRRAWFAVIQPNAGGKTSVPYRGVDASQTFDENSHTATIKLNISEAPPYLVRRIEIQGLHRFPDRFVRRRILLREGHPLDQHALEVGLTRLVKTGYFRSIHKEDIHVETHDLTRTADVILHLQEAGQQRASLSGATGQFGGTFGIAYTVFNLLQREELLGAKIDGGPETLQLLIGLTRDGFLGSRGSLAISVFNNLLRPRLAGGVKGPFYNSETRGLDAGWSYAATNTDTLGLDYRLSHSTTDYSLPLSASLGGATSADLRSDTSSHSLGTGWTHDTGKEHASFADSASGAWLGGNENLLRSSGEYSHLFADPIFSRQNAWAFRTSFSATGSYAGDAPLYVRSLSGADQVRGLRTGELGPYAVVAATDSSGNAHDFPAPAGANLVISTNTEYRVPLGGGAEAEGFLDMGYGRLLPNWLGRARPLLVDSTNGILHSSTGIELTWTVPAVQVPIRGYYAVNLLRLNQWLKLPDGTSSHVRNRISTFGWALGNLF